MPETVAAPQVDIEGPLTDMWRTVLLVVPKLLAFVAILVIGWLLARLLYAGVRKLLDRVGFDRAVDRGGLGRMLRRARYDASDILAKLVYYTLLLLTLQLAFGVWGPNPISDLISGVVGWLPKAAVAIVIVVVATAIARAVRDLVTGALGALSYGPLLANLAAWFIIGLGAIAALNQVGIATTVTTPVLIAVLATVAGILVVGVGGGLVRPMQQRWEAWLGRVEEESTTIRAHARAYAETHPRRPEADLDDDPERTTRIPVARPEAETRRVDGVDGVDGGEVTESIVPGGWPTPPSRPTPPPMSPST